MAGEASALTGSNFINAVLILSSLFVHPKIVLLMCELSTGCEISKEGALLSNLNAMLLN